MFGIGERKDLEDEDLELRKAQGKSVKDLNPQNARRRREPIKPWGKVERIFIASVLVLTIGISGVLFLSSRDWKLPGLPRVSLSPFEFIAPEETIVIGNTKSDEGKSDKALSAFNSLTKNLSGVYGLYVIRLKDHTSYGVYEKEVFQAASLIKLPLLGALYKESEKGTINLDTIYSLKDSDKIEGAGGLISKPAGYKISYRELAHLMARDSDNTAFKIIKTTLGNAKINQFIKEQGMTKTSLENNETSPYDIGLFFDNLSQGKILNKVDTKELLDFLTNTSYEKWLVKGIPKDVKVAHKYGREVSVVNDGGIVYSDKPFVLVILSKGVIETEADKFFPDLAKAIYEVETSN